MNSTNPDIKLLCELKSRLDDDVRDVLRGAKEVALVNFHNLAKSYPKRMWNPGDLAIWLGAKAVLRRLGVKIVYECAMDTYSPQALERAAPRGPILLIGGGDFGDMYDFPGSPQRTRMDLLRSYQGVPIVQLPIAVHFRDEAYASSMGQAIAEHGDVVVMVRDRISERRARAHIAGDIRLTPDMAFALGPLDRSSCVPTVDLTWMAWRPGDDEYVDHGGPPPDVDTQMVEWTRPMPAERSWPWDAALARLVHIHLGRLLIRSSYLRQHLWKPYALTFQPLSRGGLERGLDILASSRYVVTGKLHGHILCLMLGIPHSVLDNSFGKVRGFYDTWTMNSHLATWADDGDTARRTALEYLNRV
ncbi:hypothetical protein G1H11_21750 [Phytoactinopolyspora alkaliphila]|uniref:Polysaccharide pyruvyl transferase domain-containing protein n=1 Tax=Phytoactinopolyspora alkaliphila TaxID=1783498 RepID=A0A6N9YSL0_9ACTN|nr:hypothetical protein [Phytoactinopolyspora alkaliphila]